MYAVNKEDKAILNALSLYCQPGYFMKNLTYEEYYLSPGQPLYNEISFFYQAMPCVEEVNIPVIPDGCVDMVISFSDKICTDISVCGTITSLYSMNMKNTDYIFGMRFKPGRFPFELAGQVKEIINHQEHIRILDSEVTFIDQLVHSRNFMERINYATAFIMKSFNHLESSNLKMIDFIMERIFKSGGNVQIKQLSDELAYSTRYIEKIFKEHTGFTPKQMCKFVRMHKAVIMLLSESGNSTAISMDCGYSDLSHMNRDLNEILGFNSMMINKKDFYSIDKDNTEIIYSF